MVITFGGLSGLPLNLETRRSALSCILGMCMGPGSVRCSGIRSCQRRPFQTCRFWVQLRKTKAPGSNVYFRESFENLSSLTSFTASILEGFIDSTRDECSKSGHILWQRIGLQHEAAISFSRRTTAC